MNKSVLIIHIFNANFEYLEDMLYKPLWVERWIISEFCHQWIHSLSKNRRTIIVPYDVCYHRRVDIIIVLAEGRDWVWGTWHSLEFSLDFLLLHHF